MKYLAMLFLGIFVGIGGEFLIPKKFYTTVGAGCIKQKDDKHIYMPELYIYDKDVDPAPILFGGSPMTFVPSYRYAYALLTGEISYLNSGDCNAIVEKLIDSRRIKPHRGPQKRPRKTK